MAPQSYELSSVLTITIILVGFLFLLLFLKLLVVSLKLLYRILRTVLFQPQSESHKVEAENKEENSVESKKLDDLSQKQSDLRPANNKKSPETGKMKRKSKKV